MKAFILAAGLGERLRPITGLIPKSLLPILGKPAIELILERLAEVSPSGIGVNASYKKKEIEKWIKGSAFKDMITLFLEDPVLGTGGALKNAEAFLRDGTFLVHNSDILSDIDLKKLLEHHLSSGNLVTLAVHNHPKFKNLILDGDGFLRAVAEGGSASFTGIAVYSSEFLKFIPPGASSLLPAWQEAIRQGYRIGTMDASGSYWQDIGTPERYMDAVFSALRLNGETVYVHPALNCPSQIDGFISLEEGALISRDALLRNCIVLKGGVIKPSLHYEDSIIGHGFEVKIKRHGKTLIGTGGSDRKYYRVKLNGQSKVKVHDDTDLDRHIEYTKFFRKHSIPVPELAEVDAAHRTAIFEDLKDLSLYSYLKCPREEKDIEAIYRKVLDAAVLIHTIPVSECPFLVFDLSHLKWETSYFMEKFIKGVRNIKIENQPLLDEEFSGLAHEVNSLPKTIIHRDFQSQNIMLKDGMARLVDYQGATIGPSAYDLASLLWDPYYRLKDTLRERLIDYYVHERNKKDSGFDIEDFKKTLLPCRLQRHMQALGAYGFLSMEKGKKYFLKHVPEGLRLLKEDLSLTRGEYPELYGLIMGL